MESYDDAEEKMKLVISAGHALKVRGAAGPSPWGLDEVNEARKVTTEVGNVLKSMGHQVTTYWDDVSTTQSENLNRIVEFHNAQGPHDLDCSIHFNAYENTTTKPMGIEVLYKTQEALAKRVCDKMVAVTGLPNRGPKLRNDLAFLNGTIEKSVLVETLFCDAKIDCDTYRRTFPALCVAIAEGLTGELADQAVPPISEVPTRPPHAEERRTLEQGDKGDDVAVLQKSLGVLNADGDFGSITDTWVRAFQAACDLDDIDGVVGEMTWAEVDDLQERLDEGEPPLSKALADQIYTMAQESEIADYSWPDRGYPPQGYIAGMALSFAYAVTQWNQDDEAAGVMAHEEGDSDTDALAWYKDEFSKLGMKNNVSGLDTLRHLFVMLIGLGPRESSGKYCEGRDLSADNVESETAEAGLFQTSWNIEAGSSVIAPLLDDFWDNPNGFLEVFKEGISPTKNNLDSYGTGEGARYQFLARFCPLFNVMVTGVGMRTLRQHWGPINRREVTLKKEADDLLKAVQALVESVA